jgi:lipopolysaccharide export LptBFGC system permease protein LptF
MVTEAQRQYHRDYYEKNKERMRVQNAEAVRRYREKHKDDYKEPVVLTPEQKERNKIVHAEYYENNKDRLKEMNRENYENNRDYYREYYKDYYIINRDKLKQQHKEYYQSKIKKPLLLNLTPANGVDSNTGSSSTSGSGSR